MALVDILIACYGGQEHLERLLPALGDSIQGVDAKVILVEDKTSDEKGGDEFRAWLQAQADLYGYQVAYSETNQGFAATNNLGAGLSDSPYICLLNSDTVPHKGWLKAMVDVAEGLPQVGIVGAKLLFPPWSEDPARPAGMVQHAGVAFLPNRMPYHLFAGWPPDHRLVNRPLIMNAVTGACLLVRRSLYEEVGGLDTRYGQGNFEDIALCCKVRELGYDVAYCPKAVLYHHSSGSNNTQDVEANAQLFLHDWAAKLESDDWLYY